MLKICAFAALALATGAGFAGSADIRRPCFANLTPEARAELARSDKAGEAWKPEGGRTKMFIRGQFYYGNQYANYIHLWYERPLHQDTSMAVKNEPGHMLNPLSWRRTVQTAREMKLDGFAFFPMNPGCMDLFPRSQMPGAEVPLLMQFSASNLLNSFDACVKLADRYRKMPNAYRLGGKPVIVGYPDYFWTDSKQIKAWKRYRRALAEKYGEGAFVVMPCVRVFDLPDLDKPEMGIETIAKSQQHLREVLRAMDGLFIGQWETSWGDPSGLSQAVDGIVVPLVRGIMAEPEFRGKYLGYEFYQAHENPYRRVFDLLSGGMTRLVSSLKSIEKLQPDFAFGSEWDEQNENVHFRPTVSNGQTTQRVMRYFAERAAKTAPTTFPGDDTSIPNVIVSYRKMLAVGEPFETQVSFVPDGTQPKNMKVELRWLTLEGKVAKAFGPKTLASAEYDQISFTCSSVEVAEHRILRPELTLIDAQGKRRVFTDGFWPMNIEAIRVLDNKWVRHALREIATGVTGDLAICGKSEDGTYEIRGSVKGPKKFRSIEVLETSDSVYMHDSSAPKISPDEFLVSVSFRALGNFWKHHSATGWVRILNAPHAERHANNPAYAHGSADGGWVLPKRSNQRENFFTYYGFSIPRAELEKAEIEIGLPEEIGVKRVRAIDVVKNGPVSFGMPAGAQAVVKWRLYKESIPPPPYVDAASFSFRLKPLDPAANLRLQVVDEDYRIWRGPITTFYRPSGKRETFHVYDETTMKAAEVTLDRNRLYALKYDFAKSRADSVDTVGGRTDSPCVFGASISSITGVGSGGCCYQHALSECNPDFSRLPGGDDSVPRLVKETDGGVSLSFTNSNFATLPMQFVPRHAGFELSMKILPERTAGEQWLLDSSNVGFRLILRDGVPEAFICMRDDLIRRGINETDGITVKGPKLKRGDWNALKVVFDQHAAYVEVNGIRGAAGRGSGFQMDPMVTSLGCSLNATGFFCGRLADIQVIPR